MDSIKEPLVKAIIELLEIALNLFTNIPYNKFLKKNRKKSKPVMVNKKFFECQTIGIKFLEFM